MKVLVHKQLLMLATAGIAALTLIACGKNSSSGSTPSPSGGDTTLTLVGDYASTCTAIGGAAFAGETHYRYTARYGFSGASSFEYTKMFYSNSSCTTAVYGLDIQGTFAIGAATTSPSGGYNITYTTSGAYVLAYGATASNALTTGCPSNASYSGTTNKLGVVFGNFSCASMTLSASPATFYNVVVASGLLLDTGATSGDNPGQSVLNSVATSTSMSFTK